MAETNKLTTFVLDGTTLNIVDPTARSSAGTATSNAKYDQATGTLTMTTVTHSIS